MAIARFVKIRIMGYKSCQDDVLRELQKAGVMEAVEVSEESGRPVEISETTDKEINQVEFCLKSFSPFQRKGIMESFIPAKVQVDLSEYQETTENFDLENVYEKCRDRETNLREANAEESSLRNKFQELLPWRKLRLTFQELHGTGNAELLLVKVPRRSLLSVKEEVEKVGALKIIEETKSTTYCLIIILRKEREFLDRLIEESQIMRLPELGADELTKTPEELLETIRKRLVEIEEAREVLKREAEKASSDQRSLMILHDHLCNFRERQNVLKELRVTESTFILEGWIKERDLNPTASNLEKEFPEIHVEKVAPQEGETPPVDLENKKIVQPFEVVTGLYGMPHPGEFDPTPLLAPFFVLFFAICLTDAGYGLLLVALALFCLKKLNLGKGGRQLLRLLLIAGIVTVVVGCLAGGMFGFQFEEAPEKLKFLRTFRNSVMILDPMQQFLTFLVFCLGLGFVQVWFGFLVKMLIGFKQKLFREAICGEMPWLILLPGLLLLGLVKSPAIVLFGLVEESPLGNSWGLIAKIMTFSGVFGMFIQPGGGNLFKRIGLGIYRLYGIVGCFGDILSYVRLFALGLATLAMATAINTMAGMAMQVPKIGIILALPILIVGHFFNMIINVLSGFIHTVRLQFVEFFTKFYQGGGRTFRPFCVENRHIEILPPLVKGD